MTSPLPTAAEVISMLGLVLHVEEGGYVRNTIRNIAGGGENVPLNTAVYYLVTPETWSGLHRLGGDELFHFYLGDPCHMVIARDVGPVEQRIMGHDLRSGQLVQSLVPGGAWQGTRLVEHGPYGFALLGTTMTPGFREDQFEMAIEGTISAFAEDDRLTLAPFLGGGRT